MLDGASPMVLLLVATLGIVGATGLRSAAAYISLVGMSLAASRIITEIRAKLYAHLQRLSLSFHYRARSGDLITRITSDVDRLRDVTVSAALPLLVNTFTLIGMVGVMFWIDWELALIALTVFPLFLLSTLKITKRIRSVARQQRKRTGAMAATRRRSNGGDQSGASALVGRHAGRYVFQR